MDHPSKRRRIERWAGPSSRQLHTRHTQLHSEERKRTKTNDHTHSPQVIVSPVENEGPNPSVEQSQGAVKISHFGFRKLDLRDLLPNTDPNSSSKNPVDQVTGKVGDTVEQAQQAANNVGQTAQNQVVQPVANTANDATSGVHDTVQNAASDTTEGITGTDPSQPVDDVPGLVSPLPAVAAQAAREQALAEQEAKAEQQDPDLPSTQGPPPPPQVQSTNTQANTNNKANVNANANANPNAVSLQIPDNSSQKPLSEPPTPLPQSPLPTQSSSYFNQQGQSNTLAPTPTPNPLSNPSPANNNNSTSAVSATGSTSLTSPTRLSLSLTASTALSETKSLVGTGTQSSNFLAQSSITGVPSSRFLTSFTPSTFATSTSASESSSTPLTSSSASNTEGAGFVGGSPTSGAPASASTTSHSGGGGHSGTPPTGTLVGGICGGVAGLVLILAAILFLLRWRKGQVGKRRSISPPVPQTAEAGSAALGGGGALTQRSSTRSTAPMAAAANFIGKLRPASSQTATTSSTGPSEKGFQKISGRKLPSVLHSGGDGYGDAPAAAAGTSAAAAGQTSKPPAKPIAPGQSPFAGLAPGLRPPSPQRSLSGSSFYRDSQGFYGGVVPAESTSEERADSSSSPTSSSPTIPAHPSAGAPFAGAGQLPGRSSPGIPNIRPGPARQPIIQQGGVVPMRTPSRPGTSQQRPVPSPIAENPRDALGRSHPSQDGSRQSRFRESTTPP